MTKDPFKKVTGEDIASQLEGKIVHEDKENPLKSLNELTDIESDQTWIILTYGFIKALREELEACYILLRCIPLDAQLANDKFFEEVTNDEKLKQVQRALKNAQNK